MSNPAPDGSQPGVPLSGECSASDVAETIRFRRQVERGLRQIEAGAVISHAEARRRLKRR